ncbi:MAG TPA: head GIN domain-containing protein, partial [Bacteroidales bacterium]|nr:head GIN domain-containing protein [Bacteroidales bacterium]
MKKSNLILFIALSIILVLIFTGVWVAKVKFDSTQPKGVQGHENKISQPRDVSDFYKIRVNRNFKVFFTQDSIKSVVITADSNLIDQIETRVENYELIIEHHQKRHQQKNIHVYVSGPYLQEISASAGAGFETVNQLNVPSLILTGNAGSQMEVYVIADTLRVTLNAGSGIKLRGKGGMFVVKANAGSRVDAIEFEAAKAVVTANAGSST